ncbi:anti-sigma factor antagonist [Aeromicrobium sp. SMF47]|uniref:Anti-sigma factor antagonist n=1 Tax=Aeromicrobium yanjiei TaxID=2662028 RepID=A0A5Q2MGV3_9ACTN|nr:MULTISPECIES: STAS domain-containing protein [Aeromicrobium]MRJ75269.1 anti-sigma factor antagonist [Aeromicrobium yanjiei]MRK02673.1 anti-sigma factor antagonist [Aeromicrobium sp. S22]QGG40272.1 anti-sigma factor antagonist [Aeromicrobium yanjiei]
MTELTFTTEDRQDGAVLSVAGDIDMQTSADLRAQVDTMDVAHRTLVLDLGGVTFVDSSGLGSLLGVKKQQERAGGRLLLSNVSPPVARIIEITRMDRVFENAED